MISSMPEMKDFYVFKNICKKKLLHDNYFSASSFSIN